MTRRLGSPTDGEAGLALTRGRPLNGAPSEAVLASPKAAVPLPIKQRVDDPEPNARFIYPCEGAICGTLVGRMIITAPAYDAVTAVARRPRSTVTLYCTDALVPAIFNPFRTVTANIPRVAHTIGRSRIHC